MKRVVAFLLMLTFVASLSISTVGCSGKADKKAPADKPAADKDKKP